MPGPVLSMSHESLPLCPRLRVRSRKVKGPARAGGVALDSSTLRVTGTGQGLLHLSYVEPSGS